MHIFMNRAKYHYVTIIIMMKEGQYQLININTDSILWCVITILYNHVITYKCILGNNALLNSQRYQK